MYYDVWQEWATKVYPMILGCGNSQCIDPLFVMWYGVSVAGELQARHF
jgi:hypothetical protein